MAPKPIVRFRYSDIFAYFADTAGPVGAHSLSVKKSPAGRGAKMLGCRKR